MEGGGSGEAAGKEDGYSFSEIESLFLFAESDYKEKSREGLHSKDQVLAFYRDIFTDKEKEEFLKVPASDLDYFCRSHLRSSSLRDLLADGLLFFKLHSTWEISICPCPECLSFFTRHDSLIPHLMCHHLNVHPFLQHNPDEEQWCAKTFGGTVWKPIDVERALNMLSTAPLDAGHLEWPLSEDFSRGHLLTEFQKGVEFLLSFQQSRTLSNSCLRVLAVVASDYILRFLDPGCTMPLHFRSLFYCSALSFRFMENESLSCFVELVRELCKLVQDESFQIRDLEGSKDGDVSWSQSEYLDAVSIQDGCDCFVLDTAKLKLGDGSKEGIALWLYEAPILPTIPQVPSRLSEILKLLESKTASFSEQLRNFSVEGDFRPAELVSWFKLCSTTTRLPIPGTTYVDSASNGGLHHANSDQMLHPSSHSYTDSTKRRRIEAAFVMMQQRLKLVKLTCELQLLELRVHRVCAVDLRMYILPLLRSFLRMKLYVFFFIAWDSGAGYVEDDDDTSGHLIEESRAEHADHHAPNKFKGETGAENDSDMAMPYLDTSKKIEESSSAQLEFGSIGSIANGVPDNMIIHGQAPGGKPLGTAGGANIDVMTSQVSSVDAALSDKRAGIQTSSFGSEAEPETVHASNSVNEGKAETESCRQQNVGKDLFGHPDWASNTDTTSEFEDYPDFETRCQKSMYLISSELDWYVRGRKTWETRDDGIFVRIGITDVAKHFLERSQWLPAQSIWRWKSNRHQHYWYCFNCEESFLDQASHMVHMESEHGLGLSCDFYCLVPSQFWQKDPLGANRDVKEKSRTLDDFFEVDHTHGIFLVDMTKIGISYQSEEQEQRSVTRHRLFNRKVMALQRQVDYLEHLSCNIKFGLCGTSEVSQFNAVIVHNFTQLIKLKQELSELCFFDYKNEISSSIQSFVRDKILLDFSEFKSRVCKILKDSLGSVRCLYLPDSFSTVLESTGKVVVNLQERYTSVGIAFAGLRWGFDGELSFEGTTKIKGVYLYDGMLYGGPKFSTICYDDLIVDDDIKHTAPRGIYAMLNFQEEVRKRLKQFRDEFERSLRGELWRPRAIIVDLHRFLNDPN